jgi:hypothetical protein
VLNGDLLVCWLRREKEVEGSYSQRDPTSVGESVRIYQKRFQPC